MIAVLVPSRGRPQRAADMVASVVATAEKPVAVLLIVDADDPYEPEYRALAGATTDEPPYVITLPKRIGYTGSLNAMANTVLSQNPEAILGAFGDDVLFRTTGWDLLIEDALATPGIAYGNDLVHAKGHPTAIFMSPEIVRALGYLAIPQSRHLWVDDAWKQIGEMTGTLRYVPECVFEHMHPVVGKAEMDQTYHEVYDGELGHKDHLGFQRWQAEHAEADAARVREAIGA